MLACPTHPGYQTGRPPKGDCVTCWAAYGRRRAKDDGLRAQGKARGGGQSSKQKGRQAVVLVAGQIAKALGLEPDDVFVKGTSADGCDLHLSPLAGRRFPFSVEVKNQESLNVWRALKQAQANAQLGRPPVLFFKRANSPLYVALKVEDFLDLVCRKNNPTPPTPPAPTL